MARVLSDTEIPQDYTCIGKITKTHGYDGMVLVSLDVDNTEDFIELESVFVEFNGKLVPFFVESISLSGKSNARIAFFDYNSDKKIDEFVGCSLYLPSDCMPEESADSASSELIGYRAINSESNTLIGTIDDIIDNPAQELFVITDEKGREVLIPAVDEFVVNIDDNTQTIQFRLPEGLLDL